MTFDRLRRIVRLRLRSLWSGHAVDRELDEELQFHLDRQIDAHIARGMTPAEARTAALRAMGGLHQRREECRDQRGLSLVESAMLDIRYAIRQLKRSPVFTAVAIASLAFGIGGFVAIFQLVDAIRLRTLPVANPHELVELKIDGGRNGWGVSETAHSEITYALWEGIREHQSALAETFAWGGTNMALGEGAERVFVNALWVSGDFFKTLRVQPARGRMLMASDDQRGCAAGAVVISHAFWQRQYGGDESIVGRRIPLMKQPFEIVGVVPPEFTGIEVGGTFDIAVPVCAAGLWGNSIERRDLWWLTVMGRLSPSFTLAQAADQVRALSPGLFEATEPAGYSAESTARYRAFRLTAVPAGHGVSRLRSAYSAPLSLLLATTGLILLLTSANLATLMLARANARRREFAVAVALGASRRRLITQIVAEALMLAAAGVVLALPVALGASGALIVLLRTEMQQWYVALSLDWRVVAFSAAAAIVTTLIFGVVPALHSSKLDPAAALHSGGRALTPDRRRLVLQRALVIGQLAVCFVLMMSAVLFVRSFRNLVTVDVGFNPSNLQVIWTADPYLSRLPMERRRAVQDEVLDVVRSIPGVESAAATSQVPLSGASWTQAFTVPGNVERLSAKFTYVTPGYFQTLQIPLRAGRDFDAGDTTAGTQVAVVNETFVRKFLNGAPAAGARLRTLGEANYPPTPYDVIGVVGDTKYGDVREENWPIVYIPLAQVPTLSSLKGVVVRSAIAPAALLADAKRRIARINPEIIVGLRDVPRQLGDRLVRERMLAWLAGAFGGLAVSLAAIGLYGLITYLSLTRRTEIGLRLALGARRGAVIAMMLRDTAWLLVAGLGAGVVASVWLGRGVGALLFGLTGSDAGTFVLSTVLLAAIAGLAAFVPAWRASRLDPLDTLRAEAS